VLVADPSCARRDLGWTPARSDLDTIVRTAANWAEQRQHLCDAD
jgi:UDP-glucose 4-epimerase